MRRRRIAAGALAAFALAALTACGDEPESSIAIQPRALPPTLTHGPLSNAPSPGSIKTVGRDAAMLDVANSGIEAFLEQFKLAPSAMGLPAPESIDAAIDKSTVVMIAKIDDVIDEGKFETEPGSSDDLRRLGIVLKPIKILRGELEPGHEKVVIGRLGDPRLVMERAAAPTPKGVAIFFLRWAGAPHPDAPGRTPTAYDRDHYVWSHISSVYVQGRDHAVSVMGSDEDKAARLGKTNAAEGAAYLKLSGLAEKVRSSNSKLKRTDS